MKRKFIAFFIFSAILLYATAAVFGADSIYIALIYPQAPNAPKRESLKKEPPLLLAQKTRIDVSGINPEQLSHPDLYLEYFLDDQLIYSTKEAKTKVLGFIFDPCLYPEGAHTLIVNLWDKDGPSAIGIREIMLKNQAEQNAN